jgi:uncharacterized membrane protein YvlD (DUF360 family)
MLCRAFLYKNFLTDEECDHLKVLVRIFYFPIIIIGFGFFFSLCMCWNVINSIYIMLMLRVLENAFSSARHPSP